MKNLNQMQQLVEKSLWLMHAIGLWTHIINNEKQVTTRLKKIANDTQ
jgi:hypothetical protein